MRVRRLGWAGIEIEAAGHRAVIDAITSLSTMEQFVGPPRTPLPPPSGPVDLALVTHLHADHADPDTIASVLVADGTLLRPEPARGARLETIGTSGAEAGLAERAIPTRVVQPWETVHRGPFTAIAVPAVDGFGDPQISWVLEAEDRRIFHAGDSTFHGWWWSIAMRHGPFHAVFLPVNGAVCDWPHRQPPSPLDPVPAATAAAILKASLAVPIHYDTIRGEPVYRQVDDPAGRFVAAAEEFGIPARVLEPGQTLDLADPSAVAQPTGRALPPT
jgi:L-ascorbate metabolism protein UlaG (beta-lactamase superfamily)